MIIEDIGDVNKNECYYEYQLYSKSIHHSLTKFIKKTREQYKELNTIKKIKEKNRIPCVTLIEDRRTAWMKTYTYTQKKGREKIIQRIPST